MRRAKVVPVGKSPPARVVSNCSSTACFVPSRAMVKRVTISWHVFPGFGAVMALLGRIAELKHRRGLTLTVAQKTRSRTPATYQHDHFGELTSSTLVGLRS